MFWALQELAGPGDGAVVTVPNYQSMESVPLAPARTVARARPPARGRLGARPRRARERCSRPRRSSSPSTSPTTPPARSPTRRPGTRCSPCARSAGSGCSPTRSTAAWSPRARRGSPQAADRSATAISLGVMSKSYGLPGLRIGWLATRDRALLARLETRKHYTSICSAAPSELIATAALRKGEEIRARNRAIIAANLPVFDAFFARHADRFEWAPPQGGCVCFPRYLGADGVEAFTRDLVREAGVVLLPASLYRSDLAPVPGRPLPDRRRPPRPRARAGGVRPLPAGTFGACRRIVTSSPTSSACAGRWTSSSATSSAGGPVPPRRVHARRRRLLRRRPAARGRARGARRRPRGRDRARDPRPRADPRRPPAGRPSPRRSGSTSSSRSSTGRSGA